MSQPVLRLTGLSKSYGHGDIFAGISFTVDCRKTVGLFGQSGSGKTTLGRCIMRLEAPSSGQILMQGTDLARMRPKELLRLRPSFQMIFQHPEVSLNPRMSLAESVAEPLMVRDRIGIQEALKKIAPLIARVGLRDEHLARYPHQLSGGEVQRAVLSRIFSLGPKLVVADEPTSMLDVSVQAQVLRLMQDLQRETGVSYVFISHDPDVMCAMCDEILWLEMGKGKMYSREEFLDRVGTEYSAGAPV
ncbi:MULTISPECIES: ABC transporter ATP-binding protein [unclassified Methanoregula]|uniref:ABC transporter ATP-binding protein n=1 Tax=unclassified Methanoregula TaxID=2649730 RepID=UPI0009D3B3AE|nr:MULTISPECIES: dipeptide/oligopeptide/nickel ABC transporter ATP-binding protein [unclassified Methanoregula]OPX64368.1 MAG: putative ABC transporter ATP-binding protein [Methanoregula sp. PtaB.Bin085]OPY34962.1 MAG: putative ABC transporter ATP-binding protein [Methanoregula sp. PtaU1.Bin006]